MDIRGYHIVSNPSDESPDGLMSTVTSTSGIVRGPFDTIRAAIACANLWAEEDAKVSLKAAEDAAPAVHTASESLAFQVETPVDNPPVIEHPAELA